MDANDSNFIENRDWDPLYLSSIFDSDFCEISDLWVDSMDVTDQDLVKHVENVERYSPIVEDISLDDDILCTAVEKIEEQ